MSQRRLRRRRVGWRRRGTTRASPTTTRSSERKTPKSSSGGPCARFWWCRSGGCAGHPAARACARTPGCHRWSFTASGRRSRVASRRRFRSPEAAPCACLAKLRRASTPSRCARTRRRWTPRRSRRNGEDAARTRTPPVVSADSSRGPRRRAAWCSSGSTRTNSPSGSASASTRRRERRRGARFRRRPPRRFRRSSRRRVSSRRARSRSSRLSPSSAWWSPPPRTPGGRAKRRRRRRPRASRPRVSGPSPDPPARWTTLTRTPTRTRGGSPRSTRRLNASWRARRSAACACARQSARRKPPRRSSSPPSTSSTSAPVDPPGRTRRPRCFASGRRRETRSVREAWTLKEEEEEEETCSWRRTAQSPRVLPGTPAWTWTSTSPSARCASPRGARRSPRSRRCLRRSPRFARTGKKNGERKPVVGTKPSADPENASRHVTRTVSEARATITCRSRLGSRARRRASRRAWTRFASRFCSTTPTTSPNPKPRFRRGASRTRERSLCARSWCCTPPRCVSGRRWGVCASPTRASPWTTHAASSCARRRRSTRSSTVPGKINVSLTRRGRRSTKARRRTAPTPRRSRACPPCASCTWRASSRSARRSWTDCARR